MRDFSLEPRPVADRPAGRTGRVSMGYFYLTVKIRRIRIEKYERKTREKKTDSLQKKFKMLISPLKAKTKAKKTVEKMQNLAICRTRRRTRRHKKQLILKHFGVV